MEKLTEQLDKLVTKLRNSKKFKKELQQIDSVCAYPFNRSLRILCLSLNNGMMTFDRYKKIREDYFKRNPNIHLFEMSPTALGTTWALPHLKTFVTGLCDSPTYEYDLVLHWTDETITKCHNIKIEVKTSCAIDTRKKKKAFIRPERALRRSDSYPFNMNFQQLKPKLCDVFIWIGIWRDTIRYWVMASSELSSLHGHGYSEKQHRGNKGEGQCHIKKGNIDKFKNFLVTPEQLEQEIINSYKKQHKIQ